MEVDNILSLFSSISVANPDPRPDWSILRDPGRTYRNAGSDMASCRTAGIVRDVASCGGSGGDVGVAAGCGVAAWSSFRGVLLVLLLLYCYCTNVVRPRQGKSTFSFKSTEAKQIAGQGIEYILSPKQTRRPLPFLLSPSIFFMSHFSMVWSFRLRDKVQRTMDLIIWYLYNIVIIAKRWILRDEVLRAI